MCFWSVALKPLQEVTACLLQEGWASFSAETETACFSFFSNCNLVGPGCLETLPWWKLQGAVLVGLCAVPSFLYVLCVSLAAVTDTAGYPVLICHRNCHTFVASHPRVWLLRTHWGEESGESYVTDWAPCMMPSWTWLTGCQGQISR